MTHKQKAISLPKRIRPVRIPARWQREMMAVVDTATNEGNGECAEWIDEDYI